MSGASGHADELPLLAFVFHPRSFSAFAIARSATGVCNLLWVIDSTDERLGSIPSLLRRLGTVLDVAGLSVEAAAERIRDSAVQGILSLADERLVWTAEVAVILGLPFTSVPTARGLTDKYSQRHALARGGLPVPGCWIVSAETSSDEWAAIERATEFPGVLKPRWGEGSRDTLAVADIGEVQRIVGESATERVGRQWVLEEYIRDGHAGVAGRGFAGYVSVESFVVAGRISHLAVTGRTPPALPFRETGFFIPSALDADQEATVLDVASAAAAALETSIGCLHTEIKLTPSGPVVIEVNGRIGGGVPEMLSATSGIDFLQIALRIALGEDVHAEEWPDGSHVGYLLYIQAPDTIRRITSVTGLSQARQLPGVAELVLNRGPGHEVDWHDGNHGHVFSVMGVADDHEGVRDVIGQIAELVEIDGV